MNKESPNLSNTELENLSGETLKDLNLITRFYYDVIKTDSHRGIIKKVTPRQFYDFIKRNKRVSQDKEVPTLK